MTMFGWLGRSATRGILTTRYPDAPPSPAEAPVSAHAPEPPPGVAIAASAVNACPVRAIAPDGVDQGRCIRCARCLAQGFEFSGPVALATAARADRPDGPSATRGAGAPLARLGRSLHVFLVDVGSCNACNLEVLSIAHPQYDASRLGIFFTNSPRHADVLLVVGVPTEAMVEPLRRAYEAIPAPKAVVATGACAIRGGVFEGNAGLRSGVDEIVPVDLYVPGCPPPPVAVLDALLRLIGRARTEAPT